MQIMPAARPLAPTALMLGNFVTGCTILAPAGMLGELAAGLGVTVTTAGLLVTFGAVMLCIGSPLAAWFTSRIDRRMLLGVTLGVLALSSAASAMAPDYASLLGIRLVMLAVGALYTPQAAGTAALIVPESRRGSTIAYVFVGWSLAAAVGLPLITLIASHFGWRMVHAGIAALAVLSMLFLWWRLPSGLFGATVDVKTWLALARNGLVLRLLAITTLQMSGQFVVFTFMGPALRQLTGAGPDRIGLVFALYGVCGFLGLLLATRIVDSWGGWRSSLLFTSLVLAGITGWAVFAGHYVAMAVAVAVWGTGFAATNSMQQVRLVAAAPPLAPASVSLNTSFLYVGQAIGSAVGGLLFGNGFLLGLGYVAAGFVLSAVALVIESRTRGTGGGA